MFDFDYNIALNKIIGRIDVSPEKVIEELFYKDFAADFERGRVTPLDFYEKFIKEFKVELGYEEFIGIWCDIFSPKEEMIDLVRRLKDIYPLYLISNINKSHYEFLYNKFSDVFSLFDALILSFEVGAIKPEVKIYEELRKTAGVGYEDIIYIDDREDLTAKAKELTLNCVRFDTLERLVKVLENYKIFVPPKKLQIYQ